MRLSLHRTSASLAVASGESTTTPRVIESLTSNIGALPEASYSLPLSALYRSPPFRVRLHSKLV
jgi:hypothetical protein